MGQFPNLPRSAFRVPVSSGSQVEDRSQSSRDPSSIISRNEAVQRRSNSRILSISAGHPESKRGYDAVLAFCGNDERVFNKAAIQVCHYHSQWRRLGHPTTFDSPALGDPIEVVQQYDLEEDIYDPAYAPVPEGEEKERKESGELDLPSDKEDSSDEETDPSQSAESTTNQ